MNETERERQQRAEEELAQKMRMEKPVAVQVRNTLRNMSNDLATTYAATGQTLDAGQYYDDFVGILRPAYRKAANFFGTQAEKELIRNADDPQHSLLLGAFASLALINATTIRQEIEAFEVAKSQDVLAFINRQVPIRAQEITNTNQKELERSLNGATAELVAAGAAFGALEVGRLASRKFRDTSLWRGNTIAATEIQNAAEGAKQIEATNLQKAIQPVRNQQLGALDTVKEWHTQGDEVVRQAHVQADLQRVGFRDAFTVGGEQLRFPGDTSLNATAGNTINCRCSSIQFLDGSLPPNFEVQS